MKHCFYCMQKIEDEATQCQHCGKFTMCDVPSHHLIPGTVLNNRFLVGVALGEGGFGITYIGRDLNLDMKVAIKEYYPNGYVNRNNNATADVTAGASEERQEFFDKGRERFLKEARVLAKFSGDHAIVDVRDFFEKNNTAYIVMEYLEGEDLKVLLKREGNMSPDKTISMLMPLMRALTKIHAQGLIHRDISPDNIRIVDNGVKLMDFGAARDMSAIANKSLSVMLKPGYAPEEQYRSKGVQGPWTDVYALCATIYKCITGITPDDSTQRVFSDELKAPSALGIEIKPNVERALLKGLSVMQKDRYQSIAELMDGFNGITQNDSDEERTVFLGHTGSNDDMPTQHITNPPPAPVTQNPVTSEPPKVAPVQPAYVTQAGVQPTPQNTTQPPVKPVTPVKAAYVTQTGTQPRPQTVAPVKAAYVTQMGTQPKPQTTTQPNNTSVPPVQPAYVTQTGTQPKPQPITQQGNTADIIKPAYAVEPKPQSGTKPSPQPATTVQPAYVTQVGTQSKPQPATPVKATYVQQTGTQQKPQDGTAPKSQPVTPVKAAYVQRTGTQPKPQPTTQPGNANDLSKPAYAVEQKPQGGTTPYVSKSQSNGQPIPPKAPPAKSRRLKPWQIVLLVIGGAFATFILYVIILAIAVNM